MKSPVREGDIIDEKCIAIGKKGDGIFKKEGFVIIVPDAQEGREYQIKITKVNEKVAFGEILQEIA